MPGEQALDETPTDPKTRFRTQVFFKILDKVIVEFDERFKDFLQTFTNFSCLMPHHIGEDSKFGVLAETYSSDIETDTAMAEYKQYSHLIQDTPAMKQKLENATVQDILLFLKNNGLDIAYPNLSILYRILGTISVSTAGAERSFSKLKLIKSYLRSTMSEERLSSLAMISINRNMTETVIFDNVLNTFSRVKKRKMKL